jgi:hypothetical protein
MRIFICIWKICVDIEFCFTTYFTYPAPSIFRLFLVNIFIDSFSRYSFEFELFNGELGRKI